MSSSQSITETTNAGTTTTTTGTYKVPSLHISAGVTFVVSGVMYGLSVYVGTLVLPIPAYYSAGVALITIGTFAFVFLLGYLAMSLRTENAFQERNMIYEQMKKTK